MALQRSSASSVCHACQLGKSHCLPFHLFPTVSSHPLDLVFLDVWGPSPIASVNGNKYYVCFIDDFSKFTWLYPISCKSDVLAIFKKFQAHVERFFGRKLKALQTDWSGEFQKLNPFLVQCGIFHRASCPHTHQQNGSAERKHKHILETDLTLLTNASLSLSYSDKAFTTTCFLINRLPSPVIHNKSLFEALFHQLPDYNFLKVFGCACWPHLRLYDTHKLDFRSKLCVFLGYSLRYKGYRCLYVPIGCIYIACNVVFDESVFPLCSPPQTSLTKTPINIPLPPSIRIFSSTSNTPLSSPSSVSLNSPILASTSSESSLPAPISQPVTNIAPCHSMTTRSKNDVHKPKSLPADFVSKTPPKAYFTDSAMLETEPTCFTQASRHSQWRAAMTTEFNALIKNGTWSLVDRKPSMNLVGCKWVFKIKRKVDGSIERYKTV